MANETRSWIFIRGLARHSGHWGPFLNIFKKHFPNDEFELLDLRGNGEFAKVPSFVSIEDNVKEMRARSQMLRAGKKVNLLTISLGSMIGVSWADLYPEDLDSLTIMNTSDRGSSYFFERMRPQNYRLLFRLFAQGDNNPLLEKKVMNLITNHPDDYNEWAEKFAKLPHTSKLNFLRQLLAGSRYEFPKHKPKTDILILASQQDYLVNSVCSERIADMWHLKPHIHESAGHDLPIEAPDWICQQIENWFAIN